jgi:hypothetical protein
MVERLHYVSCFGLPGPKFEKIKSKVELLRGNDEPCEMILETHEAERLRDDLQRSLEDEGIARPQ